MKFTLVSPVVVELTRIKEGFIIAKDYNMMQLKLETDAYALKIMLDTAEYYPRHELYALIQDVANLLQGSCVVHILHAHRDVNVLTHILVRIKWRYMLIRKFISLAHQM